MSYDPSRAVSTGKKRRVPLVLIIVGSVVVVIGLIALIAFLVLRNTSSQDFYKIGKDEVPTVQYILGENRKAVHVSTSVENGVRKRVVEYQVSGNQNREMEKYAQALMDDYGFYETTPHDFSGSTGRGLELAKESVEDGFIVIVEIEYDRSGYTITILRGKGTLRHS